MVQSMAQQARWSLLAKVTDVGVEESLRPWSSISEIVVLLGEIWHSEVGTQQL